MKSKFKNEKPTTEKFTLKSRYETFWWSGFINAEDANVPLTCSQLFYFIFFFAPE